MIAHRNKCLVGGSLLAAPWYLLDAIHVMKTFWHVLISSVLVTALIGIGTPPVTAQEGLRGPLAFEAVDLAEGAELLRARANAIDLTAYPILGTTTYTAQMTFRRGQRLGRDPHVLSKVGDCNSAEWLFLYPFGEGRYRLGPYPELQSVVAHYQDSLAYRSYAAHNGLNVMAVHEPLWADPKVCQAGETPLTCEYRLHNPSVAVIMFGTNDMLVLTPEQFDRNLRRVIVQTLQAGIVPILSTFPRHLPHPERSIRYNQLVVRVALDLNIPLINLWLALEPLPSHGIDDDGYHLNGPLTGAGDFASAANLQTGYPLRNLVTLQTLEGLWRSFFSP